MRKTLPLLGVLSALLLLLGACASKHHPIGYEELLSGDDQPRWTLEPAREDSKEAKAFCGTSHNFASEAEARDNALQNARQQIIDAMGTFGQHMIDQVISSTGTASAILDPGMVLDDATRMVSEAEIRTRAREFHVQKWARTTQLGLEYYYRAYVLVNWSNADAEQAMADAIRNQAEARADEVDQRNINRALELMDRLRSDQW